MLKDISCCLGVSKQRILLLSSCIWEKWHDLINKELDKRFAVIGSKKVTKPARVEATVLKSLTPISKVDICKILPSVSATTIEVVLAEWRQKDRSLKSISTNIRDSSRWVEQEAGSALEEEYCECNDGRPHGDVKRCDVGFSGLYAQFLWYGFLKLNTALRPFTN